MPDDERSVLSKSQTILAWTGVIIGMLFVMGLVRLLLIEDIPPQRFALVGIVAWATWGITFLWKFFHAS